MDGLLVDTETADWEAWQELYARRGVPLRPEEYAYHAGRYGSWSQLYNELARITGEDPAALHAERLPRFLHRVEARLYPPAGLQELLAELQEAAVPCAVASASDRDWVERLLDGISLRSCFHAVVTGHDCAARKPAPDCYLRAARQLQVTPQACVALEDSATGIEAARRAGLRVVAVPNDVTRYQDLSRAHLCVTSFRDLCLDRLLQLFRAAR